MAITLELATRIARTRLQIGLLTAFFVFVSTLLPARAGCLLAPIPLVIAFFYFRLGTLLLSASSSKLRAFGSFAVCFLCFLLMLFQVGFRFFFTLDQLSEVVLDWRVRAHTVAIGLLRIPTYQLIDAAAETCLFGLVVLLAWIACARSLPQAATASRIPLLRYFKPLLWLAIVAETELKNLTLLVLVSADSAAKISFAQTQVLPNLVYLEWLNAGLCLAALVALNLRQRWWLRHRSSQCEHCGYLATNLGETLCPECGKLPLQCSPEEN